MAMFQSTPVITDGRTGAARLKDDGAGMFQSTPVITDGRTGQPVLPRVPFAGFNPRPSSLTGEPLRCQSIVGKRFFGHLREPQSTPTDCCESLHGVVKKVHLNQWLA